MNLNLGHNHIFFTWAMISQLKVDPAFYSTIDKCLLRSTPPRVEATPPSSGEVSSMSFSSPLQLLLPSPPALHTFPLLIISGTISSSMLIFIHFHESIGKF